MTDKVKNPLTGRPILINGPTFKKLVKDGIINSKGEPITAKKSSTKKSSTKKSSTKKSSAKKTSTKKSSSKKSSTKKSSTKKSSTKQSKKSSVKKILKKMQNNRTEITVTIKPKQYVKLLEKYEKELEEIEKENYNKTIITYLPDEDGEERTSWPYSIILKDYNFDEIKKITITLRYKEYVKEKLEEILRQMKKSKKDMLFTLSPEEYVVLEKKYKKEIKRIKRKNNIDVEVFEKYGDEIDSFMKEDDWDMEHIIFTAFMNNHPVQKVEIYLMKMDEDELKEEKKYRKKERKEKKRQKKSSDYLDLVLKDGLKLSEVPIKYRTETMCLAAVEQNGLALQFVPEKLRYTRDFTQKEKRLSFAAVRQNGLALEFVPSDDNSYEDIARNAIRQNPMSVEFLKKIIYSFTTPEYNERITYNLYFEAVSLNKDALKFVPEKWKKRILEDIEISKKNQEEAYEEFKKYFGMNFRSQPKLTPEIEKKYKFLALHLHPDKLDDKLDDKEIFKEINSHYQKGDYAYIEKMYDKYKTSTKKSSTKSSSKKKSFKMD